MQKNAPTHIPTVTKTTSIPNGNYDQMSTAKFLLHFLIQTPPIETHLDLFRGITTRNPVK